ncbi:hypothetical protein HPB50_021981 [Hyalomma asiaticum]|uniref:Uncharacterized protein n=1 Tax=Hyalomma asiaticum TaxID=266040 RepID=A0ACB7TP17_HYAAI|nr:hypothetical protein HPB50_021981 [Hyalomma asiaticum]
MSVASSTSKSMKKPDVNDAAESILLSVVQPTSSSIYDVAEERHLQELALQFAESSSAAETTATPSTLPQTSDNPIDAEERARRQAAKAKSPSLPAGPAERGPEQSLHTVPGGAVRTTPVTPITVSLIQEPVAKLQAPIATPVTSLTSSVLATVSSLFGAPVVLTPTPPSAPMGSYRIVPQLQLSI